MATLTGKVAVVTGASKGIGAGIAKSLAGAGASVVVNYAGDKAGAERVVAAIKDKGGKAVAVQADVSKKGDIVRLFEETTKAFGEPSVLVNNAGVFQFDPLEEVAEAEFHRQFNTNVLGLILTTQEAVKRFGKNGGSVINIGSVVSDMTPANSVVYSATKGAVDAVTRVLARELGPRGVRVNSINPGLTVTEGTERLGFTGGDMEKHMISLTPLGRAGRPEDMGKVAVFLAGDEAGWVTGQHLQVSGGLR